MAYRLTLRSLARTDLDGIEAWYEHAAASIRDRLRHELDAAWSTWASCRSSVDRGATAGMD